MGMETREMAIHIANSAYFLPYVFALNNPFWSEQTGYKALEQKFLKNFLVPAYQTILKVDEGIR
jgi:hypothetical protein